MASSLSSTANTSNDAADKSLLWTRLASFVSVLPLGVWTLNHLYDNLHAYFGKEAWEKSVTHYANPAVHAATLAMVLVPLGIHTVWGIQRLKTSKPNNRQYGSLVNWRYLLQRVSAVGVLLFLAAHIWLAMLEPRLVRGHAETFEDIAWHIRHHWQTTLVYVLGTLGVAYHFANGLAGFNWTWGIVAGRKAQRRFDVLVYAAFVLFLAGAWGALWALWQAGESVVRG